MGTEPYVSTWLPSPAHLQAKTWEEDDQISVTSGQCQGCISARLRSFRLLRGLNPCRGFEFELGFWISGLGLLVLSSGFRLAFLDLKFVDLGA